MAVFSSTDATVPKATTVLHRIPVAASGVVKAPEKILKPTNLKASANKGRHFQYTTASVVAVLTIALFTADFVLLGQSGEAQLSWLGNVSLLWKYIASSSCVLDSFISVTLITLIAWKLGYCRRGGVNKADSKEKRATSPIKSTNAPKSGRGHGEENNSSQSIASSTRAQSGSGNIASAQAEERPLGLARWNQAIDFAARQGDSRSAVRLLREFEQTSDGKPGNCPDNVTYNLVIRSCAKRGDFRGAEEWLAHMESRGVEATVCSYNTVLDACAKADNAEACEAWLAKMQQKGVEANVISYATAIYAWARRGEERRAEAWLNTMVAAGVAPDAVSYNSLIHACGVGGNAVGAERWLVEMQARGLEATVTSFTSVMDAAAKAGDIPKAEKWLELMINSKVEPNVVSFCAMIDACAKASDSTRAEYWHDRMIQCGVEPNAYSYSAVINACSKAGDVVQAEAWLDRSEQSGIANDVVVYSSVIDACSKAGDAERAMVIFKRIKANGLRAHVVAYAALARPFAYRGDWETVESIAEDMTTNGVRSNEYFLYAQLLSYATARPRLAQRAEECFRKNLRLGLQANDHVVGALCRAVGRERCVDLMTELCNGRSVPLPGNGRPLPQGNGRVRQAARRQ